MPIYRITFGFAGSNLGWTETHAISSQVTTPLAVLPSLVPIQTARVAMLGYPFVMNGTRISAYSDGGATPLRVPRQAYLDKTIYQNPGNAPGVNPSEPSPVQLEANGTAALTAPNAYQGNENTTYLGGPFDDCVTNAGQVLPAVKNLANSFNAWKAALIAANIGWLAVTKVGPPLVIVSVSNLGSGQLEWIVAGDSVPPLTDKAFYNLRVSGVNSGRAVTNGAFVAQYAAASHSFTSKELVAFTVPQIGGQLQPYSRVNTFVPYGNLTLGLQTIKHKRGRPFLSAPGRARKRIRA